MSDCCGHFALAAGLVLAAALGGCGGNQQRLLVDPRRAYIDAAAALRQAADDPDPVTRTHTIEAISQTLGQQAGAIYKQVLGDPYPSVRFAAAMAIGDVLYQPAAETLLAMAQHKTDSDLAEPDKRVLCAILYALHRLGNTEFTSQLGPLIQDDEKEVRANATMVLGRMGEKSAIHPLRMQLDNEQDPSVQLQIVESMAMLGDQHSALLLEAHTKTTYLEDRLVAIEAMQRVRSPRSLPALRALLDERQPARVRVAAGGALARLGEMQPAAYKLALRAAEFPRRVARASYKDSREISEVEVRSLQRLAVISLGWMNRQEATVVLHSLLSTKDGGVRVAAAMSLVRLLKSYRLGDRPPVKPEPKPAEQPATMPRAQKRPAVELHGAGDRD